MNVVQIVSHFDLGGAERIAINIAKSKESDINYHMIEVVRGSSNFSRDYMKELETAGIKYYRSPFTNSKMGIVFFPIRLIALIKKVCPIAIHTHTEIPDLSLYWTCLLAPRIMQDIKIVRTLHNTVLWNKWKSIGRVVEKFMQKHKANISTSNMITCTYQKEFGFDSNIKLIYNGFTAISQQIYPYIYSGKINILFAGRFVPQKGIPVLINIIKRVDEKVFYFHIAGKGPLEEIILQELGNKSNVRITPPIFSLAQYLSSFDYVFIPSEHEGLNSLSIESSTNKVPVIINDIDGLNETLPQNYPLKVKNNCIDEYMTLFTDVIPTIDRVSLIDSVYQYSCQKFDIQQMQKQYEYIYKTGKKYGCFFHEK